MSSANVFLLTSEYEGYGMTLAQAGIAGCPVVTTDVGAAGSVLRNDENALICPVGDTTCVSGKIIRIIHDHSLGTKLSFALQNEVRASVPSQDLYVAVYIKNLEKSMMDIR